MAPASTRPGNKPWQGNFSLNAYDCCCTTLAKSVTRAAPPPGSRSRPTKDTKSAPPINLRNPANTHGSLLRDAKRPSAPTQLSHLAPYSPARENASRRNGIARSRCRRGVTRGEPDTRRGPESARVLLKDLQMKRDMAFLHRSCIPRARRCTSSNGRKEEGAGRK